MRLFSAAKTLTTILKVIRKILIFSSPIAISNYENWTSQLQSNIRCSPNPASPCLVGAIHTLFEDISSILIVRFSLVLGLSSGRPSSRSRPPPPATKRSLLTLKNMRLSVSRSKLWVKICNSCAYGRSANLAPRIQTKSPRLREVRAERELGSSLAAEACTYIKNGNSRVLKAKLVIPVKRLWA